MMSFNGIFRYFSLHRHFSLYTLRQITIPILNHYSVRKVENLVVECFLLDPTVHVITETVLYSSVLLYKICVGLCVCAHARARFCV